MRNKKIKIHPASFKDPSGHLYLHQNTLLRQINTVYKPHLKHLINSGLYQQLTSKKQLVTHQKKSITKAVDQHAYQIIAPQQIPFISYPYEWCFSQLKDAALLTLNIQLQSLEHGMALKDASAFNIQFIGPKPILIDTLSFEIYKPGKPWIAYRQFCQHFLAPLALMAYKDLNLNKLLINYIDGIPLDFASKLLPTKTKINFGLLSHIHLNAKSQKLTQITSKKHSSLSLAKKAQINLIKHLKNTVAKLTLPKTETQWGKYYTFTNYSKTAFKHKQKIVDKFLQITKPKTAWDIGANTGVFSVLASKHSAYTISLDLDPVAVEKNYASVKKSHLSLLPLVVDLTNPSPAIGWNNQERSSLLKRGPADTLLVLAFIHHLVISKNLPLQSIARLLSKLGKWLIIEFIPKDDSQTQKLLKLREDIFDNYTQENFEEIFTQYFHLKLSQPIKQTKRTLYLMKSRHEKKV